MPELASYVIAFTVIICSMYRRISVSTKAFSQMSWQAMAVTTPYGILRTLILSVTSRKYQGPIAVSTRCYAVRYLSMCRIHRLFSMS